VPAPVEPEPEPEVGYAAYAGQGTVAVVLYEYEVCHMAFFSKYFSKPSSVKEDNEMNLVEGEFMTDVEEIDRGWWTGVGLGGKTGLFPCKSFVCLLVLATTKPWSSELR
jgi:drebrin-like protein